MSQNSALLKKLLKYLFEKWLKQYINLQNWIGDPFFQTFNTSVVFWALPKCLMCLTRKGFMKRFPYVICTKSFISRRQLGFFGECGKLFLPFYYYFLISAVVLVESWTWGQLSQGMAFWEVAYATGLTSKVCVGRVLELIRYCARSRCGAFDLDIVRATRFVYCNSRRHIKNL